LVSVASGRRVWEIAPNAEYFMEFGSAAGWRTPCRSSCSAWGVASELARSA